MSDEKTHAQSSDDFLGDLDLSIIPTIETLSSHSESVFTPPPPVPFDFEDPALDSHSQPLPPLQPLPQINTELTTSRKRKANPRKHKQSITKKNTHIPNLCRETSDGITLKLETVTILSYFMDQSSECFFINLFCFLGPEGLDGPGYIPKNQAIIYETAQTRGGFLSSLATLHRAENKEKVKIGGTKSHWMILPKLSTMLEGRFIELAEGSSLTQTDIRALNTNKSKCYFTYPTSFNKSLPHASVILQKLQQMCLENSNLLGDLKKLNTKRTFSTRCYDLRLHVKHIRNKLDSLIAEAIEALSLSTNSVIEDLSSIPMPDFGTLISQDNFQTTGHSIASRSSDTIPISQPPLIAAVTSIVPPVPIATLSDSTLTIPAVLSHDSKVSERSRGITPIPQPPLLSTGATSAPSISISMESTTSLSDSKTPEDNHISINALPDIFILNCNINKGKNIFLNALCFKDKQKNAIYLFKDQKNLFSLENSSSFIKSLNSLSDQKRNPPIYEENIKNRKAIFLTHLDLTLVMDFARRGNPEKDFIYEKL
ncbi:MAG: hypothetical protein QM752_07480 [Gammaproteobacteria bacterium]